MRHGGNVWEGGAPEKWLDFSANLRPEGPPDWAADAMRRALSDVRYYPDRAMAAARRGLAAYAGVSEANILPTAGGIAAIDLALSLRGGAVRVESPTFGEYADRAAAHGRPVRAAGETVGAGDTVVLCNPNNPTGTALSREAVLLRHAAIAAAGGELIVDEAFVDYCPDRSVRKDVCETLAVVGSLTKILCVPGARLGYVCADEKTIARLERAALPWQLNALAAAVAAALPGHLDELRRDASLNDARRAAFAEKLSLLGARVLPSRANFLLCDFGRDMTATAAALKEKGILVRTCGSFGLGGAWLRLAVRTEEENDTLIGEMRRCMAL